MSYQSNDLIYRLRMEATHGAGPFAALLFEAANEIERLRTERGGTRQQPERSIRHDLPA